MSFKKIVWALSIGLAFFAGTLVPVGSQRSSTVLAQSPQTKPPKYLEVDYMKVQPGKDSDYLRVEQETWKPMHQERIKKGELRSWALYGVRFPFGTDEKYDYITVNTFDRFGQLENPFADLGEIFKKVHPNMKADDLEQQTNATRHLIRSEVWQLIDETQ